jgi:hypothetical protein
MSNSVVEGSPRPTVKSFCLTPELLARVEAYKYARRFDNLTLAVKELLAIGLAEFPKTAHTASHTVGHNALRHTP